MKENAVVRQHNELIESRLESPGKMTLMEHKILKSIISEIKPDDKDFREYQIRVSDYKALAGVDRVTIYNEVKEAIDRLFDRRIKYEGVNAKGSKRYWTTTLIISPDYDDGVLRVSIDPKLKPYLINLDRNYTKYELKYVMQMKSTYSIRLYELLKAEAWKDSKKWTVPLDRYKQLLEIENEYERIFDLEKRVLKPSRDEINRLTDLTVDYIKIKKNKTIVAIEYSIALKSKTNPEDCDALDDIAKRSGLNEGPFKASQIQDIYTIATLTTSESGVDPCDYIRLHLLELKNQNVKTVIKSPYAWLKKALKDDYLKLLPTNQVTLDDILTDENLAAMGRVAKVKSRKNKV